MQNKNFGGKFNYYQIILFFIFAVFVFSIYSNVFNAPFVVDDISNIVENRHIRMTEIDPAHIKEILKSPSPRPLANFSFSLNYYFDQYNPLGYHIVNIIIHIINGILLFLFIKITLSVHLRFNSDETKSYSDLYPSPDKISGTYLFPAFFTAVIWLVNPLHIQSVTYVVQRMNAMAAMFYMGSLLLYIKGRLCQNQIKGRSTFNIVFLFSGSIISGFAALASKEIAATLPFIIIVYEWLFFQGVKKIQSKKIVLLSIGAMILTGIFVFILLSITGASPLNRILSLYEHQDFTLSQRILTESRVLIYYISLIFFPDPSRLNLAYDYPLSFFVMNPWTTLMGLAAVSGLFGFVVLTFKKDRLLSFCVIWFLVTLVIESSVIPLALIFEHRIYLPSMMVSFLFVLLLSRIVRPCWMAIGLMVIIISGFSVWTYQRNSVWSDNVSLWRDGISKSPENAWMYLNLGIALANQDEAEAIAYVQKALQKQPDFPEALFAMGVWHANHQQIAEAIDFYKKALQLKPDLTKACYQLALSLVYSGDLKGAGEQFSKVLLLDPANSDAFRDMGNVLSQTGKYTEAVNHYMEALRIDPENYSVFINLGNTCARMGNLIKAIDFYAKALQSDPYNDNAQKNLRSVLKVYQASLPPLEAVKAMEKYVQLYPGIGIFQNEWRVLLQKK